MLHICSTVLAAISIELGARRPPDARRRLSRRRPPDGITRPLAAIAAAAVRRVLEAVSVSAVVAACTSLVALMEASDEAKVRPKATPHTTIMAMTRPITR